MVNRILATFTLVIALVLLAAPIASAGNPPGSGTGGPAIGGPGLTPEEQAVADQKQKLADDYLRVRSGNLAPEVFAAEYRAFAGTDAATFDATPDGPEPIPTPPTLSMGQYAQTSTYYCGPAAAYEILHYLGVTAGPSGESLTQSHLASKCQSGYLCTDTLHETPWYYYSGYQRPMQSTLNAWKHTSWYIVHVGSTGYQSSLVFDIDHHYPVAMLVREQNSASTPHLVGHPTNITIGHWIGVHGYDSNGSWSYYADSVHGTTFWNWSPNVPAHSWISSGSTGLANMMDVVPFGYIW